MKASEMTNERIAEELIATISHLSDAALACTDADDILREAAARLRKIDTYCAVNEQQDIDNGKLRANLKVAEDALEAASDAFRFCIEQCELELGPKMVGKLCDDGQSVERALATIRGEGGNDAH